MSGIELKSGTCKASTLSLYCLSSTSCHCNFCIGNEEAEAYKGEDRIAIGNSESPKTCLLSVSVLQACVVRLRTKGLGITLAKEAHLLLDSKGQQRLEVVRY